MKTLLVFLISFSFNSTVLSQNSYPKFDFEIYKDKFETNELTSFDMDSIDFRFDKLYELNIDDYYCIFQRELNYSSVNVNPYYLYSVQSKNGNYRSITVLHYKEALYTNLILLTFDLNGQKISEVSVAIEGGDGSWWFEEKSNFENDSIINSSYIESELIEEKGTQEIWRTKRIGTVYGLNKKGQIRTISIDSTITKEIK
jgi:hypothetical protein